MARSIEFPPRKFKSGNLVDRRLETGLNSRSQKNERARDRIAKISGQYSLMRKGYKNRTEGTTAQRKQDEALKRAARRRLRI